MYIKSPPNRPPIIEGNIKIQIWVKYFISPVLIQEPNWKNIQAAGFKGVSSVILIFNEKVLSDQVKRCCNTDVNLPGFKRSCGEFISQGENTNAEEEWSDGFIKYEFSELQSILMLITCNHSSSEEPKP